MTTTTTERRTTPRRIGAALLALALAGVIVAAPARAKQNDAGEFRRAAAATDSDLQKALDELSVLRQRIADQKMPLNRKLRDLENELTQVRAEFQEASRTLDQRTLDMTELRKGIQGRKDEQTYLSSLFDEYVRNLESRLHISELQRYESTIEAARLAPENDGLTPAQVYDAQTAALTMSVDRIDDLMGGTRFEGTAVGPAGQVEQVDFALVGPVAVFSAKDGSAAGLAEQRLGSLEPNMVALDDPASTAQARELASTGTGRLPFDPTLGNAEKVEQTEDTVEQHIAKGGPVMVPILILAAIALIVAVAKWWQLSRVRQPSKRRVTALLESVKKRDFDTAGTHAARLPGPIGEMLRAGLEHVREPKELIEEVMFETTLETKLRLQRFLSFIAVSAAAAPLLGLLGTVTGIINTFKLITVYGTGDAKTLSSGISEALITTEFGLIVAIPSLLLHAYLSRKARRLVDGMEKSAVSFLNRVPSARSDARDESGNDRRPVAAGGCGERLAPATGLSLDTRTERDDRDL